MKKSNTKNSYKSVEGNKMKNKLLASATIYIGVLALTSLGVAIVGAIALSRRKIK